MKSYTDLEQSKKLAEILSLKSADMTLPFRHTKDDKYFPGCVTARSYIDVYNEMIALPGMNKDEVCKLIQPCWSLGALLQVLPLGIYDESDNRDYELKIDMIDKMPRYIRLGDVYHSNFPYDFKKDTLLDNIVESIIWLNDNNYFKL